MEEMNAQGMREVNPELFERLYPQVMMTVQELMSAYPVGYRFTDEMLEGMIDSIMERSGMAEMDGFYGDDFMDDPMNDAMMVSMDDPMPEVIPTVGGRGRFRGGRGFGGRGNFRRRRRGFGGNFARGLLLGALFRNGFYCPYC